MNIVRSWREQKVMLRRRFPYLIEEDFEYEEGQKEGMMEKLALKMKKTRLELEAIFAELQLY